MGGGGGWGGPRVPVTPIWERKNNNNYNNKANELSSRETSHAFWKCKFSDLPPYKIKGFQTSTVFIAEPHIIKRGYNTSFTVTLHNGAPSK